MSQKEEFARDIDTTFLNPDEFAEVRHIAGRDVLCAFYATGHSSGADEFGTVQSPVYELQAATDTLPPLRVGQEVCIGGQLWNVLSIRNEYGISVLQLRRRA